MIDGLDISMILNIFSNTLSFKAFDMRFAI